MDKSLFKIILYKYYNDKLPLEQALELLKEYCSEHKIDEDKVQLFLTAIVNIGPLFEKCLLFALDYYKRKYKIVELIDVSGGRAKTLKFI